MANNLLEKFKKFYIAITGYSYTNMGRLFLRLFVGIMLMQFGVRQIANYYMLRDIFPMVFGMSPATSLVVLISVEMICSLFIMCGFMTRVMCLPPFIVMITAEYFILHDSGLDPDSLIMWAHQSYLPVMFLGIYFFIMLVGPGKISVDYFLSLHFIHSANRSETELEEV